MRRPRFEIQEGVSAVSGGARFWWRLVGGNGEIMATSEQYTSHADAIRGAKAARRAARTAKLEVEG